MPERERQRTGRSIAFARGHNSHDLPCLHRSCPKGRRQRCRLKGLASPKECRLNEIVSLLTVIRALISACVPTIPSHFRSD